MSLQLTKESEHPDDHETIGVSTDYKIIYVDERL